ncbi:hypothetical protein NDU88_001979 [Pleurodeles waltl]|uniref:Uncharacterized protein n=1 Tax=Pleurodeles waltl TaxID=8319 RepID=A0AAV7KTC1_PLEWA|nr:hypothetical protein NDU88_001979 [Pleurodeles waltl]
MKSGAPFPNYDRRVHTLGQAPFLTGDDSLVDSPKRTEKGTKAKVMPSHVGMTNWPDPGGFPAVAHSRPFLECGDQRSQMSCSDFSVGAQISPGQARKLGSGS